MRIHRHRRYTPRVVIPHYRLNERIDVPEVRVIDQDGNMLGVISTADAIAKAQEHELDLVEVSPKANPPVCKILDFGQFKYQKEKEVRKQRAQSKEVDMKGVRLSVRIGEHDMETRRKQASKFLDRGDKVKIELPLRGREKAHKDVAQKVVERFMELLKEDYDLRVEQQVKFQAGRMTAIVTKA